MRRPKFCKIFSSLCFLQSGLLRNKRPPHSSLQSHSSLQPNSNLQPHSTHQCHSTIPTQLSAQIHSYSGVDSGEKDLHSCDEKNPTEYSEKNPTHYSEINPTYTEKNQTHYSENNPANSVVQALSSAQIHSNAKSHLVPNLSLPTAFPNIISPIGTKHKNLSNANIKSLNSANHAKAQHFLPKSFH